jgi:hypothetical protein
MNHWIPKVLKLLRTGKDYPKGGSKMKMENKNIIYAFDCLMFLF